MWLSVALIVLLNASLAWTSIDNNVAADNQGDLSTIDNQGDLSCDRVPPSLWCSCPKLSKECGWTDACEKYTKASRNKPVLLTLLYESLCPDCQVFVADLYQNVYLKFKDYVQIELVPYGNAQRNNQTIKCQHGEEECKINKYESCAIHYMPEPLPFIYCLETQLHNRVELEQAARKCYAKFHTVPHIYDQIVHCFNSDTGTQLQMKAADRTENVYPDEHEFVPWMLFNNASVKSQQFLLRDLSTAICQWYVGDAVPPQCGGLGLPSRPLNKTFSYCPK